ncbi:MAG: tRNA threonylcarbamoyladenosine biosynthesis protein TsaE [Oceanicaulis sp. HLUCCA04]|nr:MAG: tRNA threonylcarbamoyladenosine biosynthesis protein TsaE [Oceanicaulis sp. HLUCCA04]
MRAGKGLPLPAALHTLLLTVRLRALLAVMNEHTIPIDGPDATRRLGQSLAGLAQPGDIILLSGGLGAGKTTLARAFISRICGVTDVPSPTYTLVQSYLATAGFDVLHADLYRVEDPEELIELGLEEAAETSVLLIEWPDRLDTDLGADRLEIALAFDGRDGQDQTRIARLVAHGSWGARLAGFTL